MDGPTNRYINVETIAYKQGKKFTYLIQPVDQQQRPQRHQIQNQRDNQQNDKRQSRLKSDRPIESVFDLLSDGSHFVQRFLNTNADFLQRLILFYQTLLVLFVAFFRLGGDFFFLFIYIPVT